MHSTWKDYMHSIWKDYMHSTPFLRSFPYVAFETVPMFHYQSAMLWNCFKGNIQDTLERGDGAHMGSPGCLDTVLNGTVAAKGSNLL